MHSEVHLFIIWDSGQLKRAEIIADIRQKFEIIDILNIKWDSDHFAQNLSRFYNQHFLPGSHKEVECGKGPFTLVILRDRSPLYEMRLTSRGQQIVNATMHDAKTLYRSWIGYGCKVHGTNNPQETRHDIFLLTGKPYAFYEDLSPIRDTVPDTVIDQNLTGCVQWQSLATLFQMLNETVDYVVLRNFAGMPQNYYSPQHGDIDLLIKDRERAAFLCNATPVFSEKHRVHYKININHQSIRFDLRFVGDNYYDADWENDMLRTRQFVNGFYVPQHDHYRYSLLYHALMHKVNIPADYDQLLGQLGFASSDYMQELTRFMQQHNYHFTEPHDHSVYFNARKIGRSTSINRKLSAARTLTKRTLRDGTQFCTGKMKGALRRFAHLIHH